MGLRDGRSSAREPSSAGRLQRLARFSSRHARVALLGLAGGCLAATCAPAPAERSAGGVAALLGAAVGGVVAEDGFVWEESDGALADWALGRSVLFVAELRTAALAPQSDVFRARVRVTRQGSPLVVRSLVNLSRTPEGSEGDLTVRGTRAAFSSEAYGRVVSVVLLDLGGAAPPGSTRWERLTAEIDAYLETGSRRGLGATVVSFPDGPEGVDLELTDDALVMAVGRDRVPLAIDLDGQSLEAAGHRAYGATHHRVPRRARPLERVALREIDKRYGAAAVWTARGLFHAWTGESGEGDDAVIATPEAPTPDDGFPPEAGAEGVAPFRALPALAPVSLGAGPAGPAFAVTEVAAGDARVHVVAIDTRQLELRVRGGWGEPSPWVAAPGAGRLQHDEGAPIVAVFVGRTPWPGDPLGGAVYDRAVVEKPKPGLSTLVVDRQGGSRVGVWPDYPVLPAFVSSLRQEPGEEPFPDRRMERAGLCALTSGHFAYAWSKSATRGEVEAAFEGVRCNASFHFGGPLDAAGFALVEPAGEGEPPSPLRTQVLHPAMSLSSDSLSQELPHEIYYLVARRPQVPVRLPNDDEWSIAPGANPSPQWLPSMYETKVDNLGVEVTVTAMAPGRFEWRIAAGAKERSARMGDGLQVGLSGGDAERAIASVGLGTGRRKMTAGLSLRGSRAHRFRGAAGLLWVDGARLEVSLSDDAPETLSGDATELPLTADEGAYREAAREMGALRERAALCVGPGGWVLLSRGRSDTHEANTKTLLELGCRRVVALDRGGHQEPDFRRAGTPSAPAPRYDVTALYLLPTQAGGEIGRL